MDNIDFTQGAIGSNVGGKLSMTKKFHILGIGLKDQWALADAMGIDENLVVELDLSEVSSAKELGAALSMRMTMAPNALLVVGNDHGQRGARLKALTTVVELFRNRCYAEEQLLTLKSLKDNKPEFLAIEDVVDFVADKGFDVEPDEENDNKFSFSVPHGSTYTIEWYPRGEGHISTDNAVVKDTAFVFVNSQKNHPIKQGLLGLKDAHETFELMMSTLGIAADEQQIRYAMGVLKGFSGAVGPKDYEAEQFDVEGLRFKQKDVIGVALMHRRDDGYLWASAPSRVSGDLVLIAKELRDQQQGKAKSLQAAILDGTMKFLDVTNNMGDGLIRISVEDLISGNNSLRIKYDPATNLVTMYGSNLKGAIKSHAKHGAKVVVPVMIVHNDPVSMCGMGVMPRAVMNSLLVSQRKVRFGGTRVFEFNQKSVVDFINLSNSAVPMVEVGDWVKEGAALFELNGEMVKAELEGGAYARVTKVVYEQEQKGEKLIFTMEVELEVSDVGEAKLRGSIKAMINSMEAAGIRAFFNGEEFKGLVFGDGVIKTSARFREMFKEVTRGEGQVITEYEEETFKQVLSQYEGREGWVFSKDDLTLTTISKNAVVGELEVMIERTSVQENVTDAAMTLHQFPLVSGCPEGDAWLKATLLPGMRNKVRTLAYLKAICSKQSWKQADAELIVLGTDSLDIDPEMGDEHLLKEVGARFPNGIMVFADAQNYVWIKASYILNVSAEDRLGSQLVGFGDLAARIVRLAAQPEVAKMINLVGLIKKFKMGARRLSESKSLNKVFAVRNGVSSKVVASRGTGLYDIEINPKGRVARMLRRKFGLKNINGRHVYMLRHPMVVGSVMTIRYNKDVSKHTMQVNEMIWRRVTAGDIDGDTINVFPIRNKKWAKKIDAHLRKVVPDYDMNKVLLGVSSEDAVLKMFGEELGNKTADDLMNKVTTMSLEEFIATIEGGARAATWHTGTSYRILEAGAIQYALGLGGVRALFLGAFLYEHRGLAGKPVTEPVEEALNSWVRCPRDKESMHDMWRNFGRLLSEVPGYVNQGDEDLPKQLLIGSEMNRLIREGGIKPGTQLLGEGWVDYHDVFPIHALAWMLGRRRLASAVGYAAQVSQMDDVAEALGFGDKFLFRTLKLVSDYIGPIHAQMGGLVSDEPEDNSGYGEDEHFAF